MPVRRLSPRGGQPVVGGKCGGVSLLTPCPPIAYPRHPNLHGARPTNSTRLPLTIGPIIGPCVSPHKEIHPLVGRQRAPDRLRGSSRCCCPAHGVGRWDPEPPPAPRTSAQALLRTPPYHPWPGPTVRQHPPLTRRGQTGSSLGCSRDQPPQGSRAPAEPAPSDHGSQRSSVTAATSPFGSRRARCATTRCMARWRRGQAR